MSATFVSTKIVTYPSSPGCNCSFFTKSNENTILGSPVDDCWCFSIKPSICGLFSSSLRKNVLDCSVSVTAAFRGINCFAFFLVVFFPVAFCPIIPPPLAKGEDDDDAIPRIASVVIVGGCRNACNGKGLNRLNSLDIIGLISLQIAPPLPMEKTSKGMLWRGIGVLA